MSKNNKNIFNKNKKRIKSIRHNTKENKERKISFRSEKTFKVIGHGKNGNSLEKKI